MVKKGVFEICDNLINDLELIKSTVNKDPEFEQLEVALKGYKVYPAVYDDRRLNLYVFMDDLKGFKDPSLLDLLSKLESLEPKLVKSDPGSFSGREYRYVYKITNGVEVSVIVSANISKDSTTCVRKVVGYRTLEPYPIYNWECND